MITKILTSIFGSRNDRIIKKLNKVVNQINGLESEFEALSDEALKAKTDEFRKRLEDGETLDALLPEAFAVCREASKRVLGMRHFDVQLLGGMVLHQGKVAEMRTGEGKTLTATLPAYLNALAGSVHVVTVNDYLARRDADWSRPLFSFLGLSVGCNIPGMGPAEKKEAYHSDITYGTNNEFGFDYLRDNMAFSPEERTQSKLQFAIVDEVDSILIDEARTPLVISGPAEDSSGLYTQINQIVPSLVEAEKEDTEEEESEGHFTIDEKSKQVHLTEKGQLKVEEILIEHKILQEGESLYSAGNIALLTHINAALRAHKLYHRDVDYLVKDDQIVIVDEHTGRTMEGRRWSEGLHQAIEAKEGVRIQNENQTLASITFQNYFRLYNTLSGMTGTADTEAFEFNFIYGLETLVLPPNRPMVRKDFADLVYLTAEEKYEAIVADIKECVEQGRPVLVGTVSIENSELLSRFLKKNKIAHNVLNAKYHAKEADIIAQAGKPGAVTIATNMAGRGTDILLGGNPDLALSNVPNPTEDQIKNAKEQWQKDHDTVIAAGGLHIIGTERHESRRIDNQLRGRAGRQGDPGSSRFYLSMEDALMRIFASERVAGLMKKLGMERGEAIEHPWVTKAIENAQRKVEARNFDIRKQLLEYDDVANDQRKVVYQQRNELMNETDISETISSIREDVLNATIDTYIPPQSVEEMWDVPALEDRLKSEFSLELPLQKWLEEDNKLDEEKLREKISTALDEDYKAKEAQVGSAVLRHFEKAIMLQSLDSHWKEHLASMDHLRQGIGLRSFAQKNPKQEYKRESFQLFSQMLEDLKVDVVGVLSKVKVREESEVEAMEAKRREAAAQAEKKKQYQHAAEDALNNKPNAQAQFREGAKVGRNEPCPCGSGEKYKNCHGKLS